MLECSYCVHKSRHELRYGDNCLGLSLHAPHKQQKLGARGGVRVGKPNNPPEILTMQ